jgi:hypothetical protein
MFIMPVYNLQKNLDAMMLTWQQCRDVIAGERVVKAKGKAYLPALADQTEEEYAKYLARALFFNATRRTLQGLFGAIFRKDPEIDPPSRDVLNMVRDVVRQVLEVGRCGVLVDVGVDGGDPYMVLYKAEQIINWAYVMVDGRPQVQRVVLQEVYHEADEEDEFRVKEATQYRVLSIVDGVYTVDLWRSAALPSKPNAWVKYKTMVPTMRGSVMDSIPFSFVNAVTGDPDIDEPPLSDMAAINLSHYRSSADLEHGRHYTALPTAWVAGFDPEKELAIGASTAWVTDNVSARAGFLEFTGQGLRALEVALQEKQAMMASLGSRMLEGQRAGVEAAETARIRQAGEEATVVAIAKNVSSIMTEAYQRLLDFQLTPSGKKALVALNTDILSIPVDPAMIAALLQAFQAGTISLDTLLWNLKEGEIIPPEKTVEDELEAVQELASKFMAKTMANEGLANEGENEEDNMPENEE